MIYKINKMNLHCKKCLKITNNSTIIEIKQDIFRETSLYSGCIDFDFEKFETSDKEGLNYFFVKLSIK